MKIGASGLGIPPKKSRPLDPRGRDSGRMHPKKKEVSRIATIKNDAHTPPAPPPSVVDAKAPRGC